MVMYYVISVTQSTQLHLVFLLFVIVHRKKSWKLNSTEDENYSRNLKITAICLEMMQFAQ